MASAQLCRNYCAGCVTLENVSEDRERLNWKQRFAVAVAPRIIVPLLRGLGATLRYRVIVEPGGFEQKKDTPPGIYCFWHRGLLPAAHHFRNWKIAILISRSFDGQLIAQTVERLGFVAVRGSSSRGGATALLAAREAYERGYNVAFTADGPRGPRYIAKPGAVRLAQMVGAKSVGAFYMHAESAWVLNTWDRFMVPKPFSTVVVSFARVVRVPSDTSNAAVELTRTRVEAAVESARMAAERGTWEDTSE